MSHVLFVCIQNAGRSQIAQALFEQAASGRHQARSAGSRPAAHVHPEVVAVMAEAGIDLSGKVPHELDLDDMRWADLVVTMGCGDECPFLKAKAREDWGIPDPKHLSPAEFREVRELIAGKVRDLLARL